jgi:acyl-CoA thioester hydrolase
VSQPPVPEAGLPDLRSRASFRNWTRIAIRYADLDPIGHVNNTAMPMFFEEARCNLIYPLLQANGRSDLELVLVRTTIEYVKELSYPGAVDIGSRVHRVGTKSLHMMHGVFDAATGACAGTGECILVIFSQQTRKSVAPPEELRRRLVALG